MNENLQDLKKQCFIPQSDEGFFSMRLKVTGGNISAEKMIKIAEIAKTYANGTIHLTSRQSIEIPFVPLHNIDTLKTILKEAGLELNNCSSGIRTVTACQGNTVCRSGNIDSYETAKALEERYGSLSLAHKFKIGVTGCFNNCLKAEENDIGIKGGAKPVRNEETCTYCRACSRICPVNAISIDKENKNYKIDENICITCGKCIKACRLEALEGKCGYIVYFGGLFGNKIFIGKNLVPILFSKEDLFSTIDLVVEFYKEHGKAKERFSNTISRIGWDEFEKIINN